MVLLLFLPRGDMLERVAKAAKEREEKEGRAWNVPGARAMQLGGGQGATGRGREDFQHAFVLLDAGCGPTSCLLASCPSSVARGALCDSQVWFNLTGHSGDDPCACSCDRSGK